MSLLLTYAAPLIFRMMILLSILLLLRGHNFPGGGFIGALIASCAISLLIISNQLYHQRIKTLLSLLIICGLICLLASFCFALFAGKPALTGLWFQLHFATEMIKLGTPLLFDIGIYCLIIGSVSLIVTNIEWHA